LSASGYIGCTVIEHTHLSSLAAQLVKTLELRGHQRQALLREAGVDPEVLGRADGRLPSRQVDRLWEIGMRESGNDWTIATDTARRYEVGALHVLGFGLSACANLIEASERIARATAIFNTALSATCTCTDEEFQVVFAYQYLDTAPAKNIGSAAILLQIWRGLLGPQVRPVRVQLANVDRPRNATWHDGLADFFDCPVQYRQAQNSIALPLAVAKQPLPFANPIVSARGDAVIADFLAELDRSAIANAVIRCIGAGLVQQENVARELNMSARTLQRRLQGAKLSFAQLLADARRDLSRHHLRNGDLAVKEIAYLLGYADPANFSRAFRAWYGVSPEMFRQSGGAAPADGRAG
jgi:AraC-like DNA-binding protein